MFSWCCDGVRQNYVTSCLSVVYKVQTTRVEMFHFGAAIKVPALNIIQFLFYFLSVCLISLSCLSGHISIRWVWYLTLITVWGRCLRRTSSEALNWTWTRSYREGAKSIKRHYWTLNLIWVVNTKRVASWLPGYASPSSALQLPPGTRMVEGVKTLFLIESRRFCSKCCFFFFLGWDAKELAGRIRFGWNGRFQKLCESKCCGYSDMS